MTDRTAPPGDDWGDGLGGLGYPSDEIEPSNLHAFGDYAPDDAEDVSDLDAMLANQDAEAANTSGPLFSATNPPGTITVTTYINGAVAHVDLSPVVTKITEAELSQEICDLAAIATEKALAGQYVFLLYAAVQQVGDSPAVRDLLSNTLGLPTPEQAAEKEAAFASRYFRNGSPT